jgi:hypothetical protein
MFEFLKHLMPGLRAPAPANPATEVKLESKVADGQPPQAGIPPAAEAELRSETVGWETPGVASIDVDSLSLKSPEKFYEMLAEENGLPMFEGEVRHGYTRASAGGTDACPRCGAPTGQNCAHFIYATNKGMRVMMAPAGFFCSKCPTVIIDERIIVAGVKSCFKYQGIVGIDFLGKKEPAYFETWNGRKPIYIFDEDEQCHGMGFADLPFHHSGGPPARSAARKKKQRRRMAKQSRRRNR